MNKDVFKKIVEFLKNKKLKGGVFSILNTILIALLGVWMFMDAKPLDESAYQKMNDKIDSLMIKNTELKDLIVLDSTIFKLQEIESNLIEKQNQVENELAKLIKEKSVNSTNIVQLSSNELFQFFAEQDTSNFLQPYIIVVE